MSKKKDNHNSAAKLKLRRHFLRTFHLTTPPDVLDCFAGFSVMWGQLREEFTIAHYTGIELRKIPGRLRMDSLEYISRPDWQHDVIDLDAYGSPWKHLLAALPRIQRPTSIFLTIGNAGLGGLDRQLIAAAGIPFDVPKGLHKGLTPYLTSIGLALPLRFGLSIESCLEALNPGGTCRYIGLHLRPRESSANAPAATPAARASRRASQRPSLSDNPVSR